MSYALASNHDASWDMHIKRSSTEWQVFYFLKDQIPKLYFSQFSRIYTTYFEEYWQINLKGFVKFSDQLFLNSEIWWILLQNSLKTIIFIDILCFASCKNTVFCDFLCFLYSRKAFHFSLFWLDTELLFWKYDYK